MQLNYLGSVTRTTEPLRLQRGDDEKHTHRNGGRLGKDEPEIAHWVLRSRNFLLFAAVRRRFGERNLGFPSARDYCAKHRGAPVSSGTRLLPMPPLTRQRTLEKPIREFTIRINELD